MRDGWSTVAAADREWNGHLARHEGGAAEVLFSVQSRDPNSNVPQMAAAPRFGRSSSTRRPTASSCVRIHVTRRASTCCLGQPVTFAIEKRQLYVRDSDGRTQLSLRKQTPLEAIAASAAELVPTQPDQKQHDEDRTIATIALPRLRLAALRQFVVDVLQDCCSSADTGAKSDDAAGRPRRSPWRATKIFFASLPCAVRLRLEDRAYGAQRFLEHLV